MSACVARQDGTATLSWQNLVVSPASQATWLPNERLQSGPPLWQATALLALHQGRMTAANGS